MESITGNKQRGAVSLFVVVFAMLIITVLTIGFLRIMVADQNQASDSDLAQSAYDSALAGVEDGKRALLYYQQRCATNPGSCPGLNAALSTGVCNQAVVSQGIVSSSVSATGDVTNPGEIYVRQTTSTNDDKLEQAYTCLKMQLVTDDYVGELTPTTSQLIPLIPEKDSGGTSDTFDTVTIRWYQPEDLGRADGAVSLTGFAAPQPLLAKASWPANRPSVMRVQLIQFGPNFTMEDFDATSGGRSNANTVFLYPTNAGSATRSANFTSDIRKTSTSADPIADTAGSSPLPVLCSASISAGGYACQMSLRLPQAINATTNDRTAYLRVTPFYNATHYQIILGNGPLNATGTNIVKFNDVQPIIDSTGRANDLFRRVISRVNLYDNAFPYPDASIDVNNDFCKDFGVTNDAYIAGTCTP